MTIGDISLLTAVLTEDTAAMAALRAVRNLGLRDGWIAAGFARNRIWDRLCGSAAHAGSDIDVVYHDAADPQGAAEVQHERRLRALVPDADWQVRNQARMHHRNADAPYASVADAMSRWLETATAIAVRLDRVDRIEVLAPYGLDDLHGLICRPTQAGRERPEQYRARVHDKGWPQRWPRLVVIEP